MDARVLFRGASQLVPGFTVQRVPEEQSLGVIISSPFPLPARLLSAFRARERPPAAMRDMVRHDLAATIRVTRRALHGTPMLLLA
jgi:hypothetical protein